MERKEVEEEEQKKRKENTKNDDAFKHGQRVSQTLPVSIPPWADSFTTKINPGSRRVICVMRAAGCFPGRKRCPEREGEGRCASKTRTTRAGHIPTHTHSQPARNSHTRKLVATR
jgi:hypothetical protein